LENSPIVASSQLGPGSEKSASDKSRCGAAVPTGQDLPSPSHTRRARKGERYPQFSTSDRQEAARFQSMSEARNDILDSRNNPVNRSAREGK
jgi:hypothetical protein